MTRAANYPSVFTITEKAPNRAFSWLKAPGSAFTLKTLLKLSAEQDPKQGVKLGCRCNYHKGWAPLGVYANQPIHCGPRGCSRWSELYEHLFCMFWASNYRPTTGHNLYMSDLDFLLNSTPFWCKNHFCSLKTERVTKYFLATNIFSTGPSI